MWKHWNLFWRDHWKDFPSHNQWDMIQHWGLGCDENTWHRNNQFICLHWDTRHGKWKSHLFLFTNSWVITNYLFMESSFSRFLKMKQLTKHYNMKFHTCVLCVNPIHVHEDDIWPIHNLLHKFMIHPIVARTNVVVALIEIKEIL